MRAVASSDWNARDDEQTAYQAALWEGWPLHESLYLTVLPHNEGAVLIF